METNTNLTPTPDPEVAKLRAEMVAFMKQSGEQQQQLMEQNATLQAQLKVANAVQVLGPPQGAKASYLPPDVELDDLVTYINHAGRPEHGKIVDISETTGTVVIEVHGKHENDVQRIPDVKFGDRLTRGTFTLDPPPTKPKVSLPRAHPKGLQTPGIGN